MTYHHHVHHELNQTLNIDESDRASEGSRRLLDELLPIRRAQFLQLVQKYLRATSGNEAEKFQLAEEFLGRNDGNYERSFQYVKSLIDSERVAPAA